MRISEKLNAPLEMENALKSVVFGVMMDNMEPFMQFNDNHSIQKCLSNIVFNVTYTKGKPFDGRMEV